MLRPVCCDLSPTICPVRIVQAFKEPLPAMHIVSLNVREFEKATCFNAMMINDEER